MPKLAANEPPPPHYYANNVRQLLEHVQRHYRDVLNAGEHKLIDRYLALSTDAQRLFARLLSRKGPWIRADRLRYGEVHDLAKALSELEQAELVEINAAAPADALLGLLTQSERVTLFPALGHGPRVPRGKRQSIDFCLGRYPDILIAKRIARHVDWVCVAQYPAFHRCQLLFFGDLHQDLSAFVLQDLGMRNYERYELCREKRQFDDRAAFDRYLRLLTLNSLSHRVEEVEALPEWVVANAEPPATQGRRSRLEQRVADKILNRLGRRYERLGEVDSALACYAHSRRHPARERRVRLLKACSRDAEAEVLLAEIRSAPWSAEEQDFAERFGRRRRCRVPITRLALLAAPEERIELHAIRRLALPDDAAWHLENSFPLSLAGLAYWPVVFAQVDGAFVNPFQSAPVDLYWEDFLSPRQGMLDARERELEKDFGAVMQATYAAKRGITNRLVNWSSFTPDVLAAALRVIPHDRAHHLARYVLGNLHKARIGFPDLFVARQSGDYEFVEVKGPTDQLQPAQRIWLKALADLQIPARVVKFRR